MPTYKGRVHAMPLELLNETHRYSLCLKGGFMGAWAASLLFISALRPNNFAFLATSFALLGFWCRCAPGV